MPFTLGTGIYLLFQAYFLCPHPHCHLSSQILCLKLYGRGRKPPLRCKLYNVYVNSIVKCACVLGIYFGYRILV